MRFVALILPILLATMMAKAKVPTAEEIKSAFDDADKDGDGCVTKEEAKAFKSKLPEEIQKLTFAEVDKDSDGCIKLPEAKALVPKKRK